MRLLRHSGTGNTRHRKELLARCERGLQGRHQGCKEPASRRSRSVAQSGSAPRSGRGGRRFESCHSDHATISRFQKNSMQTDQSARPTAVCVVPIGMIIRAAKAMPARFSRECDALPWLPRRCGRARKLARIRPSPRPCRHIGHTIRRQRGRRGTWPSSAR